MDDGTLEKELSFAQMGALLDSQLPDPTLRALKNEAIAAGSAANRGADRFTALLSEIPEPEPKLTQSEVDEYTKSIMGDFYTSAFRQAAKIFDKTADKPTEKSPQVSLLAGGLAFQGIQRGRGEKRVIARRNNVERPASLAKITSFWTESGILEAAEGDNRGLPVPDNLPDDLRISPKAITSEGAFNERASRQVIVEYIKENNALVESDLDLSELKFAIATEIFKIFAKPEIITAATRANLKGLESMEMSPDDPRVPVMFAADFMLAAISPQKNFGGQYIATLQAILDADKERAGNVPSEGLAPDLESLQNLSVLYRNVRDSQLALMLLDGNLKAAHDIFKNHLKYEASMVVGELGAQLIETRAKVIGLLDEGRPIPQSEEDVEEARQAVLVEDIIRSVATSGLERFRQAGLLGYCLKEYTTDQLDEVMGSPIRDKMAETITHIELAALEPEIAVRYELLAEIDAPYELSNSQMRKRDAQIITDTKNLQELISKHDHPIPDEQVRALISLMRGLHYERTGKNANNETLAETYLEDVRTAREFLLDLEYLGKPSRSKLVDMIHLLDELIDAGAFDQLRNKPAFRDLDEFILAYLLVREPAPESEPVQDLIELLADEEVGFDENPAIEIDEQVFPIEALGQALYEDIKVFPPGSTDREVSEDYRETIEERDLPAIEWERITRLIQTRDKFVRDGLEVNFMRTKHASWQVLPFFILELKMPGTESSVAVIESPVYGNATYIYREGDDRKPWRDIVQKSRQDARKEGAVPMVHVDGTQLEKHFAKVWNRVISELTIHQPVSSKV